MKYKTFNQFIETANNINENRVKDLGDRLKDLQQRSATTDVKAQKTAKLARKRFNDLSDKEREFRKGVEDFANATKD
jgi:hypothetical protein